MHEKIKKKSNSQNNRVKFIQFKIVSKKLTNQTASNWHKPFQQKQNVNVQLCHIRTRVANSCILVFTFNKRTTKKKSKSTIIQIHYSVLNIRF